MKRQAAVAVEGLAGPLADRLAAAVGRAAAALKCPGLGAEIGGMDEARARALNRKFRREGHAAEVLSFPLPSSGPGGFAGEILVCPAAAARQARRRGVSPGRWMEELCVHGYLHLLGYRHDDAESSSMLFSLQRSLMRRMGKPS